MSDAKGVAIVTGCAQGIGKAIAIRLASDGYDLVLSDILPQKVKLDELQSVISEKTGRKAISVICDVSVEKEGEALVTEAVDKLGGLDVVCIAFVDNFYSC